MDSSLDATIEPDISKIERSLDDGVDDEEPYSISIGILFRPQESNLKNLEKVNYLGECKIVAGMDRKDTFTGFSGRREKVCIVDYEKNTFPHSSSVVLSTLYSPKTYLTIGNDILTQYPAKSNP
jgi:hypothetical protein